MNLGFKTKFADGTPTDFVQKILDGKKIHTIRDDKNDRWGVGTKIHFATGIRTKQYNCFKIAECVSTQQIEFKCTGFGNSLAYPSIFIDGREIKDDLTGRNSILIELSQNDGFKTVVDFFEWEGWNKKNFKGKILHWTNKRY